MPDLLGVRHFRQELVADDSGEASFRRLRLYKLQLIRLR